MGGSVGNGMFGGTPGYIPPETLRKRKWFPRGDVFSLGVVMFQMTVDSIPASELARGAMHTRGLFCRGCRTMQQIFDATNTLQPPFNDMPQDWPDLIGLTQKCLEKDWRKRQTPQQ